MPHRSTQKLSRRKFLQTGMMAGAGLCASGCLVKKPQFAQFLAAKRRYDPDEMFQSNWYRHYRRMFA